MAPPVNERLGPVGARLRGFAPAWENLTSDKWVLQTISTGYRIEFTGPCQLTRAPLWTQIPRNIKRRQALESGLEKMLKKQAIIPVNPLLDGPGFYSSLFLVEKRSGGWRPILNLRNLNTSVSPPKFKMDTLKSVMSTLGGDIRLRQASSRDPYGSPGPWAVSLDLEDAYFHVAVDPRDTKFLRFAYNGTIYEFQVLPFGLSTAPRTFTRLVRAVGAYLKTFGINIFQYLDDWLVVGETLALTLRYRDTVRAITQEIGFILNEEKSDWVPTQFPLFLGSVLDLQRALAFPSDDRIDRLRRLILRILKSPASPARLWQSLFGHLASMIQLVPGARRHIRPLQYLVQERWTRAQPDSTPITLTTGAREELQWWLRVPNLTSGVPFSTPDPELTVVTDASSFGWGGHLGDLTVSGTWSPEWSQKHINWLELQAVWLTLEHFLPQVQNTSVEILSDNSTTVSYINKQGGTHSLTLCKLALELWDWCDQHQIVPSAIHLAGERNVLADALSRGTYCPTEWCLNRATFQSLCQVWDRPAIDMFASVKNTQLPVFYSLGPDPQSSGVNALTMNWDGLYGYAYPPIALIPRVLRKILRHPSAMVILIAPFWPSQIWFRPLTNLLTDLPRRLQEKWNLLRNSETHAIYPEPGKLRLTAWRLSADPSARRDFQRRWQTLPPRDVENLPEGFMMPVHHTLLNGVLHEQWIPILPL